MISAMKICGGRLYDIQSRGKKTIKGGGYE